jgi:hypothetical protein
MFEVLVGGIIGSDTGDPSGTATVALYAVTGTKSAPVYTSIATTLTITPFYSNEVFMLSASLIGASLSGANGLLIGSYQAAGRAGVTVPTVLTTVVAGLDFNAGNPLLAQGAVLGFVVGVTFGTSDASNVATLTEFTIES